MPPSLPSSAAGPIGVVVVLYESAAVIDSCLESLAAAAPGRGVRVVVVDNASRDDGATRAERRLGPGAVVRLPSNRGYAAGVNAGFARLDTSYLAVLNPDTLAPHGALDRLADVLDAHPRAGLVAPRVVGHRGRPEPSVGRFPTLARERAHAWLLDRLLGREGRLARFPEATAEVDWASGCAWLLRAEARAAVGPLDEGYFMYYEDVDYCRRLHDAGWSVLATPDVRIEHALGHGSAHSGQVPADGGAALLRYFGKFHRGIPERRVRSVLAGGWSLRLAGHRLAALLGNRRSSRLARRYALALEALDSARS